MITGEEGAQTTNVDDKIRDFMARKSPLRTLSKTIAEKLSRGIYSKSRSTGITYERTKWHSGPVARA